LDARSTCADGINFKWRRHEHWESDGAADWRSFTGVVGTVGCTSGNSVGGFEYAQHQQSHERNATATSRVQDARLVGWVAVIDPVVVFTRGVCAVANCLGVSSSADDHPEFRRDGAKAQQQ
jgi:hypothetical protein